MSLGEDYIAELSVESALKYFKIKSDAEKGIWITKDGRKIPIEKMTTSHIENTIKLLERKNIMDLWLPWIERFKKELEKRKNI